MSIKKLFSTLLITLLCFTLAACNQEQENVEYFTVDQLDESIYLKQEDRFYPLAKPNGATSPGGFFWVSSDTFNVPHLRPDDELVIHTIRELPSELTIYSMTDFGYTTGILFSKDKDGDISFQGSFCPGSVVEQYYTRILKNTSNIKVTSIGGTDATPKMIHSLGLLKGLSKDEIYDFSFYQGTEYHEEKIKADSHAWITDKSYVIKNYVKLRDRYFTISLPSNMTPGYWFLDGYGMFYLEEDVVLTGEDMQEVSADSTELLPDENILDEEVVVEEIEETPSSEQEEPVEMIEIEEDNTQGVNPNDSNSSSVPEDYEVEYFNNGDPEQDANDSSGA